VILDASSAPATSRVVSRRAVLGSLAAGTTGVLLGGLVRPEPAVAHANRSAHEAAADIRRQFLHGWNGYKRLAWGHDEVHPLSGGFDEFFVPGHPIALSIIEALDTLYVMELDDELHDGVRYVVNHVDFDIDGDFHVFEAIIRVVGGLEAGYLATGNKALLDLCVDLTDRLLPAFTESPTGMPYQFVNLRSGAVSGPTPPLAEIGTNILEFGTLSRLTGNPRYYRLAKRAQRAVVERRSGLDLLGQSLDVETGEWTDATDVAPNPPVDSFYEYLWGGWAMFGDRDDLHWFRMLNRAMTKHLAERRNGLLWYKQVDFRTGATLGRRQSELAAFWAEILGSAGDVRRGYDYYRSWTAVLDRYPVIPEEIDYTTFAATSKGNQLRPEYVNSSFDMYLQFRDPYFRTTALQYFAGMKQFNRVPNGYTIVDDVTTRPMVLGDLTPAYWFAENMKYLYLMFADSPRFNYRDFYLSTEGKVLRGLLPRRRRHR
jgi:Glycosyl hydrolase family 47